MRQDSNVLFEKLSDYELEPPVLLGRAEVLVRLQIRPTIWLKTVAAWTRFQQKYDFNTYIPIFQYVLQLLEGFKANKQNLILYYYSIRRDPGPNSVPRLQNPSPIKNDPNSATLGTGTVCFCNPMLLIDF